MKSIFKKLAFVLALAMVVTLLPTKAVAAAESSDGPDMYKTLLLYLNSGAGDSDADGNDITGTYSDERYASVWGWREAGYTAVEFESADPDIATVNSKGRVSAVKVGSTTVTATFTADDLETVEKTCKVTVKKNAYRVGLSTESATKVADGSIKVGDKVQLTGIRKDETGLEEHVEWNRDMKDYTTDSVRFLSLTPEIFTVTKTTGMLTAVSAGEGVLKVWAVQSEGFDGEAYPEGVSREYTVKITSGAPTVTNATVKSVTKLELNVSGVTAENVKDIKITNQYDAPLNVLFKDPVLSEDGATVTLERYTEMTDGEILCFAFGEEEPYELVVAIGALDHIVIEGPASAVVGVDTDISVKFLDAAGVELSAPATGVRTTIDDSTYAYLNEEERKITMYETGRSVKVQVIYDTGRLNDDWTPIEMKSNEFTITCVASPDLSASAILYKLNGANGDFSAKAVTIYMNSPAPKLLAQVTLSDNAKLTSDTATGFTFETLNPAVLLVNPNNGDMTPVSAGTARVLVKYEAGTARITKVAIVEVRANAELRSVSPDKASDTVSNAETVGEKTTFTFNGHDQYGQDFDVVAENAEITQIRAPQKEDGSDDDLGKTFDGKTITFDPVGHVEGTYTYRVAFGSNISAVVSIIVRKPVTNDLSQAASYRIVPVSGNVTVDAADFAGEAEYQFKIVAQDRTGVAFDVVKDLASGSDNNSLVVRFGSTEYVNVKENITPDENGVYKVSFVVATVSGSAISGSAITAADVPAGKNVVVDGFAYEVKEGDFVVSGIYKNRTIVPVTGNVTVKKSAPGITVADTEINADSASPEAAASAVLGQLNANDAKYTILDANVANTSVGTGRQYVLLRSIRVAEKIADGRWVIHTVDMNRYFSVTVQ